MVKSNKIKASELLLLIAILFLICSSSLYWYGRFNKTTPHTLEMENRATWEKNTQAWQKDATDNINGLRESQKQVLDVLNANIAAGRLIVPESMIKKGK